MKIFKYYSIVIFCSLSSSLWAWPPTDEQKAKWQQIIYDGSTEELQDYVDNLKSQGEDISQWFLIGCDDKGHDALTISALAGNAEMVQLLLDNGASVHNTPEGNITPLQAAAADGYIEIIQKLISAGADLNADGGMMSPLYAAIMSDQLATAQQLVSAGAQLNQHNIDKMSPLHFAAEHGKLESVILLLNAGANIEGLYPEGESANSRRKMVEYLTFIKRTKEAKAKGTPLVLGTPLNRAAVNGHVRVVNELMKRSADVSKVQDSGRAILQQVYPAAGGIAANFHQYYNPAAWTTFAPRLQKNLSQLRLVYSPSSAPLINQGVRLSTLNIPDNIRLIDSFGNPVTRIESYLLVPDLIRVSETEARHRGARHMILLTGDTPSQRSPWIEPSSVEEQDSMFVLMDWANRLHVSLDEVAFYQKAHHELMLNDFKDEFTDGCVYKERKDTSGLIMYSAPKAETFMSWDGASGFVEKNWAQHFADMYAKINDESRHKIVRVGAITQSTPLKNYWGTDTVPSDPVVIENTDKLQWQMQGLDKPPIPLNMDIGDFVMEQFLDWHRPQLARLTIAALEDMPKLKQKATEKGVNLVCLGCGGGEDLRICHKAMQEKNYTVRSLGIERLSLLRWNAEHESSVLGESACFIAGDAHESAELIRQHRKADGLTIVVAEDFLVQQVLPGPYSALKILQQLIQPGIADMVVIGGVHHSLVNRRMASAAGWLVQEVDIYHSEPVTKYLYRPKLNDDNHYSTPSFVLTRPNQDSEWTRLQQLGLRRSTKISTEGGNFQPIQFMKTLDLSMSGLPNQGLQLFLDQKKSLDITQVDLSYTYLAENQLDETIHLLLGFPKLVHVMVSGFEPWYDAFLEAVKTTGRFKLVLRKDNQYRHELPTLDPSTAKLLGQYKTMPNERVFAPSFALLPESAHILTHDTPAWTADINSGYLMVELLPDYQKQLLEILSQHAIQLQATTNDGLCFFHAIAMQLHIHESELRASLYNHLVANQQEIQTHFPQFSGEQFNELMAELLHGAWGDAGQAQLAAWVFNKRIILLYFNSQTGAALVQILNPNGSVNQGNTLPDDFSLNDIVLVHNGQGHWVAAGGNTADVDLLQHNAEVLHVQSPIEPPEKWMQRLSLAEQRYIPELFPKLIALLLTAWQMKFK